MVGVGLCSYNWLPIPVFKKGRGSWGMPGDHVLGVLGDREERLELGVGFGCWVLELGVGMELR